jgi:predicted permease
MTNWFRRLCARIRYRRFDEDLKEELEFHRTMKQSEIESAGLSPDEARIRAIRELGNVTFMREESRAVWIAPWLESLWQDIRYALRSFRKHPSFTLTAATTLFLAIGLNTSLFTLFNAVFLRPWPVKDPSAVFQVWAQPYGKRASRAISIPEYRYLRGHTTSLNGLIACIYGAARLRDGSSNGGEYLQTGFVTAKFFNVLGIGMEIGRGFVDEEDRFGAPRSVVVISEGFWKRHFGGDPAVIGRTVDINNSPFTIIGVAARGFDGLTTGLRYELWIPLPAIRVVHPSMPANMFADPNDAYSNCHWIAGRLAPRFTPSRAAAELDALSRHFRAGWKIESRGILLTDTSRLSSMNSERRRQDLPILGLLFAALAIILLIACANISNLQLARTLARRQEIGMRMALGASRARLVRQLLTESLILSCAVGVPAVAIARVLPQAVIQLIDAPADFSQWLVLDQKVLAFALGTCVFAALVFGLLPALRGTRISLAATSARQPSSIHSSRLRGLLLASQIALTSVLLIGASLLSRGILRTVTADWGFAIDGTQVVNVTLPSGTYRDAQNRTLYASLMNAIESSGFGPVGVADIAPLASSLLQMDIRLPEESDRDNRSVNYRPVSKDYFDVLGIPLVAGRWFDERSSGREVVINETFAREFWPDKQAVGQTFVDVHAHMTREVVGIVKDTHVAGLNKIEPLVHTPPGMVGRFPSLLIRDKTGGAPNQIRSLLQRLDPRIKVTITPLGDNMRSLLKDSILGARVAWAIGLLGLTLAAVGIFGVFAYFVEQRRQEIGIRMALGARPAQVVRLILGMAQHATCGGLTVGLLLSLGVGPLLNRYLYGLNPLDPIAYAGIVLVILVAAALATYIPARRATRVDPTVTLRSE